MGQPVGRRVRSDLACSRDGLERATLRACLILAAINGWHFAESAIYPSSRMHSREHGMISHYTTVLRSIFLSIFGSTSIKLLIQRAVATVISREARLMITFVHLHTVLGASCSSSRGIEDLARIHEPVRIKARLQLLHHADSVEPKLLDQRFLLTYANAMLTLRAID